MIVALDDLPTGSRRSVEANMGHVRHCQLHQNTDSSLGTYILDRPSYSLHEVCMKS